MSALKKSDILVGGRRARIGVRRAACDQRVKVDRDMKASSPRFGSATQ